MLTKKNYKNKNHNNFKFQKSIRIILILISLFILISSIAQISYAADDINSYEYLKIKIENNISFEIEMQPNYNVNYLNIESHFFPRTINKTQYLNKFETSKSEYKLYDKSNNFYLVYSYDDASLKNFNSIENDFILESTIFEPEIKNKEPYPIKYVSLENQK